MTPAPRLPGGDLSAHRQWETHIRATHGLGYCYPARLTGPDAASNPPHSESRGSGTREAEPG